MSKPYLPYLKTLRRIPKDVVLAVASRHIQPDKNNFCLCGWAVREMMARFNGAPAERKRAPEGLDANGEWRDAALESARLFGGNLGEWYEVYYGITDSPESSGSRYADVETAFTLRVMECAR